MGLLLGSVQVGGACRTGTDAAAAAVLAAMQHCLGLPKGCCAAAGACTLIAADTMPTHSCSGSSTATTSTLGCGNHSVWFGVACTHTSIIMASRRAWVTAQGCLQAEGDKQVAYIWKAVDRKSVV